MVKNTGGNKQKRQGRKFIQSNTNTKLRESEDTSELYACVIKMSGGDNCIVKCIDGNDRTCIIRKKFRGKNRRYNKLESGVWCLIGLRDWQSQAENKKEKCDLLEVYDDQNKYKLIQKNNEDFFKIFTNMDQGGGGGVDNSYQSIEIDTMSGQQEDYFEKVNDIVVETKEEEFNFDDI